MNIQMKRDKMQYFKNIFKKWFSKASSSSIIYFTGKLRTLTNDSLPAVINGPDVPKTNAISCSLPISFKLIWLGKKSFKNYKKATPNFISTHLFLSHTPVLFTLTILIHLIKKNQFHLDLNLQHKFEKLNKSLFLVVNVCFY